MLCIAYFIKMYVLLFNSFTETLTSLIAVAVVIGLLSAPILLRSFLLRKHRSEQIGTDDFLNKHGEWVRLINTEEQSALYFNVFFMGRRILFAFIIVVLPNLSWLQRQLFVFICSLTMIYTGMAEPFQ